MGTRHIILFLFSFSFVIMAFQNCGGDEVAFRRAADSENPFGVGETRKILVDPNLADNRPPIHLTTIIDNSFSTSEIQEQMNQGFAAVADRVQGFNVVANLYTTSHDSSADKSSTEISDIISYRDADGKEVILPSSEKNRVPANTDYVEKRLYGLAPSFFPNRQPLSYRFGLESFDVFKDNYFSSIADLGTAGADQEQGLCTLLKKIEQNRLVGDPDNRAFHVYLLASNENDFTTLASCPLESSQATEFLQSSETVNCSASDPECRHSYSVSEVAGTREEVKLNYTYDEATVKVHYTGERAKETYRYTRETASHQVRFEVRESTYTYRVTKYCPVDNIPVPCASSETKTRTVKGSCNLSQRTCNGGDLSEALSLFGLNSNSDIHACQVSCQENWRSKSLASQRIPGRDQLCSSSQRNCNSEEIGLASSQEGTSNSHVRSCSRTCQSGTESKSKTFYNRLAACTQSSRDCSSSEISEIAAPALGVAAAQVNSCSYSCAQERRSGNKTLSRKNVSCSQLPNRQCTSEDRSWVLGKNIGLLAENLTTCDVRCTDRQRSGSRTISESVNSCDDNISCESRHVDQVAGIINAEVSDVKSCSISCQERALSAGTCRIANNASPNLCLAENAGLLQQLCTSNGHSAINMNTCERTVSQKEITSVEQSRGPASVMRLNDLPGVEAQDSIPTIVSKRLRSVHGSGGFFASFFTYPKNDGNCTPPSYLSTGDRYHEVAEQLGDQSSRSYPVCLNDYSPALDVVLKLAIENVLTNFNLDIVDQEEVFRVVGITIDGEVVEIPENQYEVFKKTVRFKDRNLLKDIKTLEFSVWNPTL
ncbi:MAG: hypothetical protein AAF203_00580 [Pseudomonadota bacterium]